MNKPSIAILDCKDQLLCITEDYFNSNLHTFLQGTAAFFNCSILQKSELSKYFIVGNKISFIYYNTAYHFDITDMTKNELYVSIQADSLTLELRNEDSPDYKASKEMTFEEYLRVFLYVYDNPLVIGTNEISDKKLKLEWSGSGASILSRLFSLANKFDAEIEFVTKLNRHWGLKEIVLNVYKSHDEKNQGIGKNRQDIILEYGNNVETVGIHKNIDNLKTALQPSGKDGLLITDVLIDERDAEGNQLFYSPKGNSVILATKARNQFMSKIGDTVRVQNKAYVPTLNLSVRVSEQDIYFDDPENNTSKFTNIDILKSEVNFSLLSRLQALIEANKKYDCQIVTDNGTTFKNNQGQTTLTARVLDNGKDISDTCKFVWLKDNKFISSNKSIVIKATDIDNLAVFRFNLISKNEIIGGAEITITNVEDGKDLNLHQAYAWSSDGKDRFTKSYPSLNLLKDSINSSLSNWIGSKDEYEILLSDEEINKISHVIHGFKNKNKGQQIAQNERIKVSANKTYTISFMYKDTGLSKKTLILAARIFDHPTKDFYAGESK